MYPARTPSRWLIGPLALALSIAASAQMPSASPSSPSSRSPLAAATEHDSPARAAPGSTRQPTRTDMLSSSDRSFVKRAAAGGLAEVQLGQLASQKATDPQVKQFAERMIADHTKANDQLKQIATSKSATLPDDIPAAEKREHDRLAKTSGADFDREYMGHMTSDHKEDIDLFRKAAKSAHDAEIRQYAASMLPTLEHHLSMAQSIEKATKSSSPKTSTSQANTKSTQ